MTHADEVRVRPVILSGGFGKRLWPLSHESRPKQFVKLLNNESPFSLTLKRVMDRNVYKPPIIVGNVEHTFFIFESLNDLDIKDAIVLIEPMERNTATAAIIAALHEAEEDSLHLILPCDHHISDEPGFHNAIAQSASVAKEGNIVLFGIAPDKPETGYGYIMPGNFIDGSNVRRVSVFTEKPDETFARVLINQGALWNSGIFLYAPKVLLAEATLLAPEHYEKCQLALANVQQHRKCFMFEDEHYETMESQALDTLIMENTKQATVLACSIGWNDVGSWHALWHMAEKDEDSNAFVGNVVVKDVKNSYIRSDGPQVAALGMEDCVIIADQNNILVAPSARAQEVRELATLVTGNNKPATGIRPWGIFRNIAAGRNFAVKHIIIWPGCSISLQSHEHRAEHWVVISGTAKAECDGMEKILLPNQSAFVPQRSLHRLSNHGQEDLQIIEVQSGNYLNEDDIVRFEDLYGRV